MPSHALIAKFLKPLPASPAGPRTETRRTKPRRYRLDDPRVTRGVITLYEIPAATRAAIDYLRQHGIGAMIVHGAATQGGRLVIEIRSQAPRFTPGRSDPGRPRQDRPLSGLPVIGAGIAGGITLAPAPSGITSRPTDPTQNPPRRKP